MTSQKQLKARIRTRMATTGERYAAARAHLVGTGGDHDDFRSVVDTGWTLRGGSDPDAAALANILANSRVVGPEGPLSEELIFLVAGGLGAGYILWEFQHDSRILTLGFTHLAQYLDRRLSAAVSRLGVQADWSRTSGAVGAAAELRRELAAGQPVVVWPDRYQIGYWQLPAFDGHGGHPVIAYAERDGRIHLDDRTLAPLTVAGEDVDRARARVGSYRNAMLAVRTRDTAIPEERLRIAVLSGLEDMVGNLGGRSDSFAVPAWRKWARMLVASGPAKAWPRVFADGAGLFGALLSVWEGVEPAGMTGGNLRREFAAGLIEAAALLDEPRLGDEAARWVEISELWHSLAEAAVPTNVAACAQARELTAAVTGAVAEGDAGRADSAAAAQNLWALRERYAAEPPFAPKEITAILAAMSGILGKIYEAEKAAVGRLEELVVARTR
ncbi:MAG TPA: BtrH N-terminal domain-containing protein [Propionibacteriaceae bacterium]|nr:BtrH N-terminal domain-containing protein [Propionibacteriaceae bacterium]